MKTLYLVRHAKAEEQSASSRDFERVLTDRGVLDAKLIGKELKINRASPHMILSSPASRAKQTATIIVKEIHLSPDNIVYNKDIYDASLKTMLRIISQTPDKVNSLMIFGHNPSFLELVNYLGNKNFMKLPKGSVVCIKFDDHKWSDIKKRSGKITYYEFPKNLREYSSSKTLL